MKKPIYFLLSVTFSCLFHSQLNAQNATPEHKDSLIQMVNRYYELNLAVFQANSTPEQIDKIFELFTEDFTYVHPKYGGTYNREDLFNGYTRNQKNGGYDGSVTDIKVHNTIIGLNAVTVQKSFVSKNDDGTPEDGEAQMTLFEFRDGKISRIFEYW